MQTSRKYLLSIGVMTGNSLDGADVVLTRFDEDGGIEDLKTHSLKSPADLTVKLRQLRDVINQCYGDMKLAVTTFDQQASEHGTFDDLHESYVRFVANAIKELIQIAKQDTKLTKQYDLDKIDLIGFHGQTCAHYPPSIAKTRDPKVVYTCQIGDGQLLANLTGISVVYDFRSDDLMNGGEGAPLAPVHHQHLAEQMKCQGYFPIAICNAGNTGNFTIISYDLKTDEQKVVGLDTGPFNNYPDKLMQEEHNQDCDLDGSYGLRGCVNQNLLKILFETAVVNNDGQNFLLQPPPKSSDPQWYKLIPELTGENLVDGQVLSFEDRVRTAEYFSAYIYVYALMMIPENIEMPNYYALCGGGWKNPVSREHFVGLLKGEFDQNPVLPEHRTVFEKLRARIFSSQKQSTNQAMRESHIDFSEKFGFDGTAMEARIFADAAVCRIKGEPFTKPITTGVKVSTVAGIIRFPNGSEAMATPTLLQWLAKYTSRELVKDFPSTFDSRWSRASAGWSHKLAAFMTD